MSKNLPMTFTPISVPKLRLSYPERPKALDLTAIEVMITKKLGEEVIESVESAHNGDPFILVKAESIWKVLKFLRDEPELEYVFLQVVSATDFLEKAEEEGQVGQEARVEVLYVLYSFFSKQQINIKIKLDRDEPKVDSVSDLFRAANWYERECYDMIGIEFKNHPNHKRILLPEDWVGHPLRKDYVFPEAYNGMKVPL